MSICIKWTALAQGGVTTTLSAFKLSHCSPVSFWHSTSEVVWRQQIYYVLKMSEDQLEVKNCKLKWHIRKAEIYYQNDIFWLVSIKLFVSHCGFIGSFDPVVKEILNKHFTIWLKLFEILQSPFLKLDIKSCLLFII